MELILEKGLEHQQKAVDAVADVLEGVLITPPTIAYQNPSFVHKELRIVNNIKTLQNHIR